MNTPTAHSDTEPAISWRQKQRQMREAAILDAAREMISEQGYEAMTMEDLAERVGISKPTLYQHFSSKETLVVRAVVAQMENSLRFMQETQPGETAGGRMERIVHQFLYQRFDCSRLLYSGTKIVLAPIVRSHPEYQVMRKQMIETLTEVVEAAKAEGAVESTLSTRVLLQMLFSLVRDTEYDELIKYGECREEEVRDTLSAIYLTGLRKKNP